MSDLSPEAKALLDGTRTLGGPSAAQKLAMKKAVLASAAAAPAAAVAVKTALGFKVGLGLAVAAVGVGVGAWIVLAPKPVAVELPERSRGPAPVVEAPKPEPEPAVVVREAEPPPPPAAKERPAPKPVVAAAPEPEPAPVAAVPPPPAPMVDEATLSRELSAIEEANETVREGRFDDVLTQLQRYEDEFPHGALSTEASVVKVLALCGLGRVDEARAIGGKLPANNPAVRRLERSCLK